MVHSTPAILYPCPALYPVPPPQLPLCPAVSSSIDSYCLIGLVQVHDSRRLKSVGKNTNESHINCFFRLGGGGGGVGVLIIGPPTAQA